MLKKIFFAIAFAAVTLSSTSSWASLRESIFVRLEAQRLGIVSGGPKFKAGEQFIEGALGGWDDVLFTTIVSTNGGVVHYKSKRVESLKVAKVEAWVDLKTGQYKKVIVNGVDKTSEVAPLEPIESFDKVTDQKAKTVFGDLDCKLLERSHKNLNYKYLVCDKAPGSGVVTKSSAFIGSEGGYKIIDYEP